MLIHSAASSYITHQSRLLEIDHVFICVSVLPTEDWLQEVGFVCAEPVLFQPDRGTLSQVVFFETMYIELIEVVDYEAAAQFAAQTGIDFVKRCRWRQLNASPFGLALRHRLGSEGVVRSRRLPQFQSSEQMDNLALSFSAENLSSQSDPLCFLVPGAVALPALIDSHSERYRQKVCHPLGMERLTHTRVRVKTVNPRSQPIQLLQDSGILTVEVGESPLLELTFDHHQQNKVLDWRSIDLPVMLKF